MKMFFLRSIMLSVLPCRQRFRLVWKKRVVVVVVVTGGELTGFLDTRGPLHKPIGGDKGPRSGSRGWESKVQEPRFQVSGRVEGLGGQGFR